MLLSKQGWYQSNPDLAANFVRAWDAVTRWLSYPATKDEVLAIAKKSTGGPDPGTEGVYSLHAVAPIPSAPWR